jgi:uncharacterized protein YndB with AHSA1/START domain
VRAVRTLWHMTTRLVRRVAAAPSDVYEALLDPVAVEQWMVPDGMTSTVHSFEPIEGGSFRITLTYEAPTTTGKSSDQADTFHGVFVRLVRDREVMQVVEFESSDPAMRGEMTITYTLVQDAGGTIVIGQHENLPPGLSPTDNELGWRMSMDKLASLVETADR